MKNLQVRKRKTKKGDVWEYRFEIGSVDGKRKEKECKNSIRKKER